MERKVDTQLEIMERKLDRSIENKELITLRLALGIGQDYTKLAGLIMFFQKAVADTIQIFLA